MMPCYVVKPKPPSQDEYKTWVMMGYLGSYERYLVVARDRDRGPILIHGNLGPHCTECAAVGENLCDYPVGDDKTCDRALCDDHATPVANDTHYCRDHFIMWREYLASERGYDVLDNVTPLGVVASGTEAQRATTVEQGVVHDGPVGDSRDAQPKVASPLSGDGE